MKGTASPEVVAFRFKRDVVRNPDSEIRFRAHRAAGHDMALCCSHP